jgi:N-acetylmuramoyl-L-alanine amidase
VVIKNTPTGWLRVRMEPSLSATEAAKVKPGEKYTLLDEKNGWYKISYKEGEEGWISGRYAKKLD